MTTACEYEAAMRNFEEGNRLRGMGGEFDRESLVRQRRFESLV